MGGWWDNFLLLLRMKGPLRIHVAAGAVVIFQGKVLLVRINKPKDKSGKWGLPGGKVDKGESLEEGMIREVEEETGIKSHLYTYRHLGIVHEKAESTCKHVFLVELKQDVQHFTYDLEEILEIQWVPLAVDSLAQFDFRTGWINALLADIIHDSLPETGLPLY